MKKFAALILAVVLLTLTASTAFAKTVYDPEKLHLVIVAADEETKETYCTIVTYKTAVKRILAGLVYEVYMLEADSLVPVDFQADATQNAVVFTNRLTGEPITQ